MGETLTIQGGSSGADIKVTMSANDTATLDLQNTGVSAGSYTLASITVDAKGRITSASSGTVTDTTYTIGASQSGSDAEIQLDASAGTDTAVKLSAGSNITLTECGGDTITIASAGGTGIGGSIAEDQVAVGSSTSNEIEGNAGFTAGLGASGAENILKFGYSDSTVGYTRLKLNGTNAYLEFADASDTKKGAIGFQSTQGLKFFAKSGGLGASEALRITPNDEWGLQGANYGTSGQVLTSGGSGSAVSWADVSAGATPILTDPTAMESTQQLFNVNTRLGGGTFSNSIALEYTQVICVPFQAPHTGTLDQVTIQVSTASSGNFANIGFYSANSTTGLPDTQISRVQISMASTGQISQTSFTGTPNLTRGELYWCCVISSSSSYSGNLQGRENNPSNNAPSTIPTGRSIGSLFGNALPNCITDDSVSSLPTTFDPADLKGNNRDLPDVVIRYG